jgi:hypothetical protein
MVQDEMIVRHRVPPIVKIIGAVLVLRWVLGMHHRGGGGARCGQTFQKRHEHGGLARFGGRPGDPESRGGAAGEVI